MQGWCFWSVLLLSFVLALPCLLLPVHSSQKSQLVTKKSFRAFYFSFVSFQHCASLWVPVESIESKWLLHSRALACGSWFGPAGLPPYMGLDTFWNHGWSRPRIGLYCTPKDDRGALSQEFLRMGWSGFAWSVCPRATWSSRFVKQLCWSEMKKRKKLFPIISFVCNLLKS